MYWYIIIPVIMAIVGTAMLILGIWGIVCWDWWTKILSKH